MRSSSGVPRVIVLVMDSVGVGELPDAAAYGDAGSNTLGHVAAVRPLDVPTLRAFGLGRIANIGGAVGPARGAYGRMAEASAGKDSVTGHWEIMGVVLDRAFPTFPNGFPAETMREFERRIGRPTLGNVAASGTAIIEALGPEHMRTGAPIVYTSADSVFQIAAHEEVIPIAELYRACETAFELVSRGLGVGRVIARPFVGEPGRFVRTARRRDFALEPFATTALDQVKRAGQSVVGVGKIGDLFAHRGLTDAPHSTSDADGMDQVEAALDRVSAGLVFANLVDFDTEYGHRNNPIGYAENLERFDARLARLVDRLEARDVLFVTADHGNDPTTPSTDHSREYVPVFAIGDRVRADVDLGVRSTFADLGQTVAEILGVAPVGHGRSFARDMLR